MLQVHVDNPCVRGLHKTNFNTLYLVNKSDQLLYTVKMIENIQNHQPHIVVNLGDEAHVVPFTAIRDIASGRRVATETEARCVAVMLLEFLEE